ncbi:MAG: sulfate adenylyltransferase [Candidatus Bathyarchaeia archaeon]
MNGHSGEPYGGRLVNRLVSDVKRPTLLKQAEEIASIKLDEDAIYDAEKIGIGAYSPLEGFMNNNEFLSVLAGGRLANGLPWTIPIVMAPSGKENAAIVKELKEGDTAALLDVNGKPFAILRLEEKFSIDKKECAMKVYGTTDRAHPNVHDIYTLGNVALAGNIDLIRKLDLKAGKFELTPLDCRRAFKERGWKNVVAYQCRNPPHTAHEYLQRCALELAEVDGLFIHPVVGRLKKGDYKPEVIMQAYDVLVKGYYRRDRTLLASLSITMRYGGPKAALFLAIVRRNYGCTHYIVGRDQAGVGSYYDPYACHKIFEEYDVGIAPIRFMETFFCRRCGWMATPKTCPHGAEDHVSMSQTKVRGLLEKGNTLPREILRPEVESILNRGDVFVS